MSIDDKVINVAKSKIPLSVPRPLTVIHAGTFVEVAQDAGELSGQPTARTLPANFQSNVIGVLFDAAQGCETALVLLPADYTASPAEAQPAWTQVLYLQQSSQFLDGSCIRILLKSNTKPRWAIVTGVDTPATLEWSHSLSRALQCRTISVEVDNLLLEPSKNMSRLQLRGLGWMRQLGKLKGKNAPECRSNLRQQRLYYDRLVSQSVLTQAGFEAHLKLLAEHIKVTEGTSTTEESAHLEDTIKALQRDFADTQTIQAEIEKDLIRTPLTYLGLEDHREGISRILIVWAKEHPNVGFKQGMTDLLVVILWVLRAEREGCKTNAQSPLLAVFFDPDHIEHDAFALLEAVLQRMVPVFEPSPDATGPEAALARPNGITADSSGKRIRPAGLPNLLDHVQNILLDYTDPKLAVHLRRVGLEPHMFMIKWVRVLFAREFDLPQVVLCWDALIGVTPTDFALLDAVCLAILSQPTLRDSLVHNCSDLAECLEALKYLPKPNMPQTIAILSRAKQLHFQFEQQAAQHQQGKGRQQWKTNTIVTQQDQSASDGSHLLKKGGLYENKDEDWFRVDSLSSEFWQIQQQSANRGGSKVITTPSIDTIATTTTAAAGRIIAAARHAPGGISRLLNSFAPPPPPPSTQDSAV